MENNLERQFREAGVPTDYETKCKHLANTLMFLATSRRMNEDSERTKLAKAAVAECLEWFTVEELERFAGPMAVDTVLGRAQSGPGITVQYNGTCAMPAPGSAIIHGRGDW